MMKIKAFEDEDMADSIDCSFKNIGLSPIVEISERAKELTPEFERRTGRSFVYFQRGEVDFDPPPGLTQAIARAATEPALVKRTSCYPKSGGEADCKDALIGHYARRGVTGLGRESVVITYGGQEGLELVFGMFRNGTALAFGPIWSCIIENIAPYANVKVLLSPFRHEDGQLKVDFADLESKLAAGVSFLYLNNPSNPTGKVFSREELGEIERLCRKHKTFILADEAYKDIVFDGKKHVSMLEFDGDHIIVSGTGSKTYAATGYRFGWLLSRNREITARFATRGNYSQTAGVVTLMQYAFAQVLNDDKTEQWIAQNAARYQRRRDIIFTGLSPLFGGRLYKPEGAFYFMPDINSFLPEGLAEKDKFFLDKCLENGFAVVPGSAFGGRDYEGQVRLSYSTVGSGQLKSVVERFAEFLGSLGRRESPGVLAGGKS